MALPEGICHICGDFGPLTFEHVPPRKAFNKSPVFLRDVQEIWQHGRANVKGRIQQRGAGAHTLCAKCNNDTGDWYADDFGSWCIGAAGALQRSGGSSGYILNAPEMYPLRVLKQIVTMFFSVNASAFADKYPELVRFVLNRTQMYLNPRFQIATYFAAEGGTRHLPVMRQFDIYNRRASYYSEITFYPLGYVLTVDSPPWDARWCDISHFARYEYDEQRKLPLALPLLPTHLPIPGDYRAMEQIEEQRLRSIEAEKQLRLE